MTPAQLLALAEEQTVCDVPVACDVLDVGINLGYQMIKDGSWPTRVIRAGRTIKIPVADLVHVVGLDGPCPTSSTPPYVKVLPDTATLGPKIYEGGHNDFVDETIEEQARRIAPDAVG
jgi:hypothetical protein